LPKSDILPDVNPQTYADKENFKGVLKKPLHSITAESDAMQIASCNELLDGGN